jgi:general secretion pathway protein N
MVWMLIVMCKWAATAGMRTHRPVRSTKRPRVLPPCAIAAVAWLSLAPACAGDAAPGGGAVDNPIELQSFDELSSTRERPLFAPTRRPPPKPVAPVVSRVEPPAPPPPPPSLVVLGIVSEDGEGRAAVRAGDKGDKGGKVVRVRAGDDLDGWKVGRVEPRKLVLTQGDRSVDFNLFSKTNGEAGAAGRPGRRPQAR